MRERGVVKRDTPFRAKRDAGAKALPRFRVVLPAERELRTNNEKSSSSVTNNAPACIVSLLAGNEKSPLADAAGKRRTQR